MHELAIAESIVRTVHSEIEKSGPGRVVAVGMRIGALTDVVPDALEFGFEAIIRDTVLDGAKIVIESIPVQGCCGSCRSEFEVNDFAFICPACHSREIEIIRGNELDLVYIEVTDADGAESQQPIKDAD